MNRIIYGQSVIVDTEDLYPESSISLWMLIRDLTTRQKNNPFPKEIDYSTFDGLDEYFSWKVTQLSNKFDKAYAWLQFRSRFISLKKAEGPLTCHYCGIPHLKESGGTNRPLTCTLDHVVPISKGGKKFSSKNIVISCSLCNNKKADLSYREFIFSEMFKARVGPIRYSERISVLVGCY
jgi:5-methylcytosine-specific restriction endonuclease McrA